MNHHRAWTTCFAGILCLTGCGTDMGGPAPDLPTVLAENGVAALPVPAQDPALVRLGQALFFDKILSGNLDTACATCHTPLAATADGLSLPIGTGGAGVAQGRVAPRDADDNPILIPRNAPDVFRGDLLSMFWDARVTDNGDGTFANPAGDDLPAGLDSALAVQAMFPVTSRDEMRGQAGDNELADLDDEDFAGMWAGLMTRLGAIDAYRDLFAEAYPGSSFDSLTFVHAANAIAAFEIDISAPLDSPFDRYLGGEFTALSPAAVDGARLFYGAAGCATCHSGSTFSDGDFHNRLVPQIGPGKGDGADGTFDFGREQVTGDPADRFKFRTPPLRNVAATGPWMHDGAYTTLDGAMRHCMDPLTAMQTYDAGQLTEVVRATHRPEHDAAILGAADLTDLTAVALTDAEFDALKAFLNSLTSPALGALSIRITPESVPSGLPVAD